MRLIQNKFLITADADAKSALPIKGMNGEALYLDRKFDPYGSATQIGEIAHVPMEFDERSIDSHNILPGDTVWFHHFVCQPKNEWLINGKSFYQANWDQIWAKVKNEQLIPVNDWIFVEPILERAEALFAGDVFRLKDERENMKGVGKVFALSDHASHMGLSVNDHVYFIKDADYEIKIGDKMLWRMKLSAVVAITNDRRLVIPLRDKIVVSYTKSETAYEVNGLWVPPSMRDKTLEGKVVEIGKDITCVKQGDKIVFFPGMFTNFTFGNRDYAILRKEFLIYIK